MGRPDWLSFLAGFRPATTTGLTARSYDGEVAEAKSRSSAPPISCLPIEQALPDNIDPLYRRRPGAPPAVPERYCL